MEAPKPQESLKPQVIPREEAYIEREAGKGGHLQRCLRDLRAGEVDLRDRNQEDAEQSRARCVKAQVCKAVAQLTFSVGHSQRLSWTFSTGSGTQEEKALRFEI